MEPLSGGTNPARQFHQDEEATMDRSTIIAGLGLIVCRMEQLTNETARTREELERLQKEATWLQQKWETLMTELRPQPHYRSH
jgi:predicted nuclease with TOPRIM domain